MASALKQIECKYFFGSADPNNKLENDDTFFSFLCNADIAKTQVASTLSAEAYQLAATMVPGGVNWNKHTIVKSTETINGKSKITKQIKTVRVSGSIRTCPEKGEWRQPRPARVCECIRCRKKISRHRSSAKG